MGKMMSNYGTQAKERARQQKQTDKAAKRMLSRQKKAQMKAGTPNAAVEIAEPISAENIVANTN